MILRENRATRRRIVNLDFTQSTVFSFSWFSTSTLPPDTPIFLAPPLFLTYDAKVVPLHVLKAHQVISELLMRTSVTSYD
jgi:hypothetical protein